eukprot:CAMPEP_0117558208 /NCGR_PEP_ID=MMETSP0784-20121206/52716_1 /TAXON_ID=39447 /ORGANISM="" /LENGTH=365 /DNA_ID=CAMNT_0005355527 /DNA_START=38 /DNA_END=1132 /DNA_ORIENTATION=+
MMLMSKLAPTNVQTASLWGAVALVALPVASGLLRKLFGEVGDQNIASFFALLWRYRSTDIQSFMKSHREAYKRGKETGDFVPGVCNYYTLMSDLITLASGPYWHFVPMHRNLSRAACHHKYHEDLTRYLEAKQGDTILEIGSGYGEMGRQVAKLSGASVTSLTMADAEIVGGNERIKAAGLEGRCKMIQGNYHDLPMGANTFDKVFGVYTLKYSADLEKAFSEAARVLKPGGKFVSYEILVTDKYDSTQKLQKYYVDNISSSTCMPPLWHAEDFRKAAKKAGLVPCQEDDLCAGTDAWYSCFERTGVYHLLSSSAVYGLLRFAEMLRILPTNFAEFYDYCIVHPATDFVNAGRLGIVTGSVMMTW